jgi:hypothetical protein
VVEGTKAEPWLTEREVGMKGHGSTPPARHMDMGADAGGTMGGGR